MAFIGFLRGKAVLYNMAAKEIRRAKLRERMFGDRAFYAEMISVVVPIIIQNTVSNVVSLLDNVMVGRVGTFQMSAVAIVNQLLFVFNLCIFGGLAGAGIFATQYAGAHDHKGVRDCFRVKWMISLSMLACALAVFIALPKQLIGMYLAEETAQADAAATLGFGMDYLTVMLWGLLPFGVTQVYASTLREVGATNKTHLHDYERAIGEQTRALLKVHTSNYRIVGFSEAVPLEDMVALGKKYALPVIQDIGSGSLVDLEQFGIHDEPTVQKSIRAGVDVVSFSGDKLLGGPQAGIIIGKKEYIDRFKSHPLARAMRVDKMTLAALRATLHTYLDPAEAVREIPTLSMLAADADALHAKAALLQKVLADAGVSSELVEADDQVGGGSVPTQLLATWAVAVDTGEKSVDAFERAMRCRVRPIIGRISKEQYLLDARTLWQEDFEEIARAAREALK